MTATTTDTHHRNPLHDVVSWAVVVLIVMMLALGYYVHNAQVSSDRAAAASDRAAAASDRAAAAAQKTSDDLAAALAKASSNTQQAAAVSHALEQIDLITRILCADRPGMCPPP